MFIGVVDDMKLVDGLGGSILEIPVEVVLFVMEVQDRLQQLFKKDV